MYGKTMIRINKSKQLEIGVFSLLILLEFEPVSEKTFFAFAIVSSMWAF